MQLYCSALLKVNSAYKGDRLGDRLIVTGELSSFLVYDVAINEGMTIQTFDGCVPHSRCKPLKSTARRAQSF